MANKGHIPWNKGKTEVYSEETKKKISLNHRKYQTVETRTKISNALKGNQNSKGNKPNKTSFKKGHISWSKGKIGYSTSRKGQTHTQKTKKKISEAKKGCIPWNKGIPLSGKALKKFKKIALLGRQKQQNMKGPTSIEKKLYDELKKRGILFEKQRLINGRFIVDAYIPSLNLVIEADGNYWHSLPKTVEKDRRENAYLKKCGYNLLRLTGTEINNGRFKDIIREDVQCQQ